ncbi:LmeA family phospholipid-binding protein [Tsukamurella sp. M9C]|uniref:LmeA family phospholipid-binding protein n=1 Tax=Tsukamurella sp. M9C TaxID=2877520 RepID=UPI001CCA0C6D|nr:LmeA family phospholipid-binding protein [Tsukamurella sp. M9C]MCA0157980.1 LmeA family phospholipid-binding protein [Tsukamurella sp. M9C]
MAQGQGRAWIRRVLIALATLLTVALLAELGSAATAEYRLSRELRAAAGLSDDPEVTIGGFPYLTSGGEHPKLTIAVPATVHDRSARLEAEMADVRIPGGLLPTFAPDTPIAAGHVEARVRLDQKTVGRYMDIVDLQVHTPAPKRAGAGSPADGYVKASKGIVLTGTVPLPTPAEPKRTVLISVAADFTNEGDAISVRATGIYSGPEDHASADLLPGEDRTVLAAFTRVLPRMALPFGVAPTGARAENADVVLLGEADGVTVTPGAFYRPLA